MPLYTRTGDEGETSLFDGTRIVKSDPRVRAYGTIDELNAVIGWAAAACDGEVEETLATIQDRLFNVSAALAQPEKNDPAVTEAHIEELEAICDTHEEKTDNLDAFVLPGGCESAARLHLARTVCRRAERNVVALGEQEDVHEAVLAFVNRLSDVLFAMARAANAEADMAERHPSYA